MGSRNRYVRTPIQEEDNIRSKVDKLLKVNHGQIPSCQVLLGHGDGVRGGHELPSRQIHGARPECNLEIHGGLIGGVGDED